MTSPSTLIPGPGPVSRNAGLEIDQGRPGLAVNARHTIWAERYRPTRVNDLVLPHRLSDQFRGFIEAKSLPNQVLRGPAGVGKTTTATALCTALGVDVYRINASLDRGIDVVRQQIIDFASTCSFSAAGKVVVLEEADSLTDEAQRGLRAVIEEYAANCVFVFICNDVEKIIPALRSRCINIDFTPSPDEAAQLRARYVDRLRQILALEGFGRDDNLLDGLVDRYFPDFRRILNELQGLAAAGALRRRMIPVEVEVEVEVDMVDAGARCEVDEQESDSISRQMLFAVAREATAPEHEGAPPSACRATVVYEADPGPQDSAKVSAEPPRPLLRELPPAAPFPMDALGSVLGPAARAIHDRVRAPLAICGQSVLGTATMAVQGHANVVLPMGQTKPLSSYFLTVALTGERKTAADHEALRPVRNHEAALRANCDVERLQYEDAVLVWRSARRAAVRDTEGNAAALAAALAALGPEPSPPLEPLLTCQEPTFEGLCKVLAEGQPSIGIFAAEGGHFIGGHGMVGAKLRTATGFSMLWDGDPIKRVRAAEGVTVLADRRVAMHLMAQPDVAAMLVGDRFLIEQGLVSRILLTAPEPAGGTRMWREPSPEAKTTMQHYGKVLLKILERPLPLVSGTRNELAPRALSLSRGARRRWINFYDHVEAKIGSGGELEPVRGLANKLPEHAARMAAVLALVSNSEAGEIGSADMDAGIALARHYAAEALRLVGASRVSGDLHEAQRLLTWLHTNWKRPLVSLPDIYQRGPTSIRDKAHASRVVRALEEHGWLVRAPAGFVDEVFRREVWRVVGLDADNSQPGDDC